MQGKLMLKRVAREDIRTLFELRYQAYLKPYSRYSSPESPCLDTLEEFEKSIESGGGLEVYGLYVGIELVGGAALRLGQNNVTVSELYVDPARQGLGIGTQALHLLESRAPSAVYMLENSAPSLQEMLTKAGYRPAASSRQLGQRCRQVSYVKEAYRQVEILLSPLRREQLPAVESMLKSLNETELYNFSGGAYTAVPTVEMLSAQFGAGKHYAGASGLEYAIEVPEYNAVIGILSLTDLEWEIRRGRLSYLVVDPRWRNVGIGRRAVDSVCRLAYDEYGIRGLTANVLAGSAQALKCLDAAGFTEAFRREKAYAPSQEEPLDFLALMRWAEDSKQEEQKTE